MKMNKSYVVVLIVTIIFSVCSSCSKTSDDEQNKRLRGTTIIETGELAAVNFRSFPLPRYSRHFWSMKITGLIEHGTLVEEGDSIIQLDPSDVRKMIVDWETNLDSELASLQTLLVNQENQKSEIEAAMKNEIASFNLKKIELEATRFEADRIRRIKELEFKQAELRLAKEKKKLALRQIIADNDLRIQNIRVNQIKNQIENAYSILPQLTIRTPISGVFQIGHNRRTNALLNVGDEVYPGNNMGSVPQLTWMKVNTQVDETDFLKLKVGQKVAVRLDAMPELVFDGEIAYIGKLCHLKEGQSRQKVFDVEVKMLQSDEKLKPGMTVSCEYLIN